MVSDGHEWIQSLCDERIPHSQSVVVGRLHTGALQPALRTWRVGAQVTRTVAVGLPPARSRRHCVPAPGHAVFAARRDAV